MKRYEFSRVQIGHMAQAVKSGDVERLNKQTALLNEIPKSRRRMALELIRLWTN